MLRRVGGEIPASSDRFSPAVEWGANWLAFSHGRAALAWLLGMRKARSAIVCAYTCPSVPLFFSRRGLCVSMFDVGASTADVVTVALTLPGPRIVLAPALFGAPPWLDVLSLETKLEATDVVIIDAGQTAFGHADFEPPSRGAVFSCPRKLTSLPDGAVLALGGGIHVEDISALPLATEALSLKETARALWATGDPQHEAEALAYNRQSEKCWPDKPHRMQARSQILLERLDRRWHSATRRANRDFLKNALQGTIPIWAVDEGTPFCLPVFCSKRDSILARLSESRIFASALWPDSVCDPMLHPVAAWMAAHLVSLPVDQRHDESDMLRTAEKVLTASARLTSPIPERARVMLSS